MSSVDAPTSVSIAPARGAKDVDIVRGLFLEYGESLDFNGAVYDQLDLAGAA